MPLERSGTLSGDVRTQLPGERQGQGAEDRDLWVGHWRLIGADREIAALPRRVEHRYEDGARPGVVTGEGLQAGARGAARDYAGQYLLRGECGFGAAPGRRAAETWVGDQAARILAGDSLGAVTGIRIQADRLGQSADQWAAVDRACRYLENNAAHLHYDKALAAGWPIAIVEGGARHLVADRLDITGSRWTVPGAEAVLTLRALISNLPAVLDLLSAY